jgi:hypothetical protein
MLIVSLLSVGFGRAHLSHGLPPPDSLQRMLFFLSNLSEIWRDHMFLRKVMFAVSETARLIRTTRGHGYMRVEPR